MKKPSGRQIQITSENTRAVVTEAGATLRTFEVNEKPIIWGFREDEMCSGGRGHVLAPWPNRLEDGQYSFDGIRGTVPIDDPSHSCAIHGLVRWQPWETVELNQDSVTQMYRFLPQPAYPFSLRLYITYAVEDNRLSVKFEAKNVDSIRIPFGIGFHPYFAIRTENVDHARLQVPADRRLILDDRGLPIGSESVDGSSYDFRRIGVGLTEESSPRSLNDLKLSDCLTNLRLDQDGKWRSYFYPDAETDSTIEIWGERLFSHIVCFSGDTLPKEIRRKAVAIEPMTCPPNALRTGDSIIAIAPGETISGSWGINAENFRH